MTDYDLESVLRSHFVDNPEEPFKVQLRLNNENRIVAQILDREFVVFGNHTAPYVPPPAKPATQKVAIPGLDAFKPMGSR